jgi:putative sterol carrier protein
MKKITFLFGILLILSLSLVSAADFDYLRFSAPGLDQEETTALQKEILLENLDNIKADYNSGNINMFESVSSLLKNEQIEITLEDGATLILITVDGEMTEFYEGSYDDLSFKVTMSDEVFVELADGELDLENALKNKEITLQGVGFLNNLKVKAIRPGLAIIGLLS